MELSNRRRSTRSQVWKETRATLKMIDTSDLETRRTINIHGGVTDIGSNGMFLSSVEYIPVPGKAEITIDFDPHASGCSISVEGETVRETKNGVGIRFTSIDVKLLQKCNALSRK